MSYCRWSSDDFQSDIYCYQNIHSGYTVMIAGMKHVLKEPLPPPIDFMDSKGKIDFEKYREYIKRDDMVMGIIKRANLVKIGLPEDGKTYHFETPIETITALKMLRDMGYRVPQKAIDELEKEAASLPERKAKKWIRELMKRLSKRDI